MAIAQHTHEERRTLPEPARLPARLLGAFQHETPRSAGAASTGLAPRLQAEIDEHLGDMVASYGGTYRSAPSSDPARTAFHRLAHRLLADALAQEGRVDRVVLAHALPDSQPGYSVCASLVHAAPGLATAFAVSDQQGAAPFTALRVAADYLRGDPDGRALVIALDQGTVPWDVPRDTPVPDRDVGVGLLLGGADGTSGTGGTGSGVSGGLPHWRFTRVDPAGAARAVDEVVAGARHAFAGPLAFVLGAHVPWTRPEDPATTVRRGPADLVCTSVWTGLAHLHGTPSGGAVVAVEYDPVLGYLHAVASPLEER